METHIPTTPFGRRPLSLAILNGRRLSDECEPDAQAEKWKLFRAVCEAKTLIGATDRALAVLNFAKNGASLEALRHAISLNHDGSDAHVKVRMCHIRQKLKPYGITIETIWGEGYRLPPESKAAIARALL